jgi:hypothetical protein
MTTFPKLNLITLRAGTKFMAELPDGTVSAERMLTENTEAELVIGGPVFNVYDVVMDGQVVAILVDVNDEVRELVAPI